MSLNIESPFWTFSLRVYASDGVAAECLALQDRLGLDVNVLLFAAWLGIVRGVTLDEAEMERINKVAAGWSNDVVLPLRRRIVEETQLQSNAMQVSPFRLVAAKREEIDAEIKYRRLLRDFWIARAELDQIVAGRLPPPATGPGGMHSSADAMQGER